MFPRFVVLMGLFLHWMRVLFVVRMFEKSFRIVQVQTPQKWIIHVHSLLVVFQRSILMGRNKRKELKIMPMRRPKPLLTIDVNNINEFILQELKVTKGVVLAPSLKCL